MTTQPTKIPVEIFLKTVSEQRRDESHILIEMMHDISGEQPYVWGPSIIGFGTVHYTYDSGREGDMPKLAFSPRKSSLTIYFESDFEQNYSHLLQKFGKHKVSKSCLYINKLADVELDALRTMLEQSYKGYR